MGYGYWAMARALTLGAIFLLAATAPEPAMAEAKAAQPTSAGAQQVPATRGPARDKLPQGKAAKDGPASPVAALSPVVDPNVLKANTWTLGLASGLPEGTFIRFGAEIARNVNDGQRLRVMPLLTEGATGNITDLLYLKGVDVALTNADVLEHFRSVEPVPNIDQRIQYIAGMYITHLHVLVRSDIASLKDLEGRKVSFHTRGAGTSVSAPILFRRLGIKVEPVYVNNAIAMEMMKTGELAGLVNSGAKPVDLFTRFKNDYGYKLLAIPFDKFDDLYVPSVLTAQDYPGYIAPGEKVETLGIPVVLAVYNWAPGTDRARRIRRFIDHFVDRFENFQKPPYHPAWRSINLAAKVPGWVRYWAAEQKLAKAKTPPLAPAGDQPAARTKAAGDRQGTPSQQTHQ